MFFNWPQQRNDGRRDHAKPKYSCKTNWVCLCNGRARVCERRPWWDDADERVRVSGRRKIVASVSTPYSCVISRTIITRSPVVILVERTFFFSIVSHHCGIFINGYKTLFLRAVKHTPYDNRRPIYTCIRFRNVLNIEIFVLFSSGRSVKMRSVHLYFSHASII